MLRIQANIPCNLKPPFLLLRQDLAKLLSVVLNWLQNSGRIWTSTLLAQPPEWLFLYTERRRPLGQVSFLNLKPSPNSFWPLKHEIEELGNRSPRSIMISLYEYLVGHILWIWHFCWFDFKKSAYSKFVFYAATASDHKVDGVKQCKYIL